MTSANIIAKRDNTLEDGLTQLRRIEDRRRELAGFNAAILELLSDYGKRAGALQAAWAESLKTADIERAKKIFAELLNLEIRMPGVQAHLSAITRDQATAGLGRLKAEFDLRGALLRACGARRTQAQQVYEDILTREQQRLGEDDAPESPPVRRATTRLEWLERVRQKILSEAVEDAWSSFAKELLDGP